MSKVYKRGLSLLLTLLMLLALTTIAPKKAEAAGIPMCSGGVHRFDLDKPEKVFWTTYTQSSSTQHVKEYEHGWLCECGQKKFSSVATIRENHVSNRTISAHVQGKHTVTNRCTRCSYVISVYSYDCPGNPCIYPV
jgi:hypothetical protein